MKDTGDTALVTAARAGDSAAYGELFQRYQKRMYTYAYGILGNPEDASDAAQDAFVRVFEALPRLGDDVNFSAYLYRTTHNIAIDAAKGRGRFVAPEALDLETEPAVRADPERVALLREQQEQTWRATFALPDSHRAILALREMGELSYQEIAEVMDMPRNTVGVLLSRARLKFKEAFRMSSIDVDTLTAECQAMLPLLSAYIDKELASEKLGDVEAHVADCAFCRLALDEMTEASRSYRALVPLLPPLALKEGVWGGLADILSPEEAYGQEGTTGAETAEPADGALRARTLRTRRVRRSLTVGASVVAFVLLLGAGALLLPDVPPAEDAGVPNLELPITGPGAAGKVPTGTATALVPGAADTREPTADTVAPDTPRQVSPAHGTVVKSGVTLTLSWEPVDDPSGVTYSVEVQQFDATSKSYRPLRTVTGIEGTTLAQTTGSNFQRWRVWAVDGAGNASASSDWWAYGMAIYLLPPVQQYEPPPLY